MAEHIETVVAEEEMLMLERAWFEYQGLLTLATQFTSDSPFKPDEKRFNEVLTHYVKAFMEYNVIMNALTAKYFTDHLGKSVEADFERRVLILH